MGAPAKIIPAGYVRGFHWASQAWYRETALGMRDGVDSMMVGIYGADGGGTLGEFRIEWHQVDRALSPRFIIFNDAWRSLRAFSDFLDQLAELNGKHVTPEEMARLLTAIGVEDLTERVRKA